MRALLQVTVFLRSDAAATIYFAARFVRLLFEGVIYFFGNPGPRPEICIHLSNTNVQNLRNASTSTSYRISLIRCCGYYLFRCSFCAATIRGCRLFLCLWKAWIETSTTAGWGTQEWELLDAVSSTHSLLVLLSAMGTPTHTTQTVIALAYGDRRQKSLTHVGACRVY